MPAGGPRQGAGAKPGYVKQKHQTIAARLLKDGKSSPLEAMVENMRKQLDRAKFATGKLEKLIDKFLDGELEGDRKEIHKTFLAAVRNEIDHEQLAQKYAVDAAPYMHAKLTSMELNLHQDAVDDKSDKELAEELAQSANQIIAPEVAAQVLQLAKLNEQEATEQ